MNSYQQTLESFSTQGRLRKLRTLPQAGSRIEIEGKEYLNFSSNDYLSLAQNERVKKAAAEAVLRWGTSASASRLVTGDLEIHSELERELASYFGQETALIFGSGFLTNIGVLTSLAGRGDLIFADKLNHASLVDGAIQSRANVHRFKHNDTSDLRRLLEANPSDGNRIIATETIFSMDGDAAPVEELVNIANEFDATLVLDEAHAVGVFGPGLLSKVKIKPRKVAIVGTMSKSLASYGGFVACSKELREYFVNTSRAFIYTTGLPPACCASALEALRIFKDGTLGEELIEKSQFLHNKLSEGGCNLLPFASQIIPIIVYENKKSVEVAENLYKKGIICSAIRPPTVPQNSARLRLSVNLGHTEEHLLQVAADIASLLRE